MMNDEQQAQLFGAAIKAISRSHDLLDRTKHLPGMPSPPEREADARATKAVETALKPVPPRNQQDEVGEETGMRDGFSLASP